MTRPEDGGRRKERTGLEGLPTEILLNVAKNLECARDLSSLGRTSKAIHWVVDGSWAWRDFRRHRFPFITIPSRTCQYDWKDVGASLSYQSRCWDRRSIRFTAMYPAQHAQRRGLAFQPVLGVDYDMDSGREIVVWGAGEDIVARYRERGSGVAQQNSVYWRELSGGQQGLRAGVDDVSAVNIVRLPHLAAPALLVGRESGHLGLQSAEPNHTFGQQLASFSPAQPDGPVVTADGAEPPRQQQVMSVDVLNDRNEGLVAACTNLGVSVYQLPTDSNTTAIPPVEVYDLPSQTTPQVSNAKWMGSSNLLALAMRGTHDPLRYLSIRPSGWVVEAAAKNAGLVEQFRLGPSPMFATSLQPIRRYPGATGTTPLLLSSWKDGTVRLQDIRTPSPFDVVYQDNVQPWCELGSLLPYGADRFIGGDMLGSTIKIFDFRWPRTYYHTTGLPCGSQYPFRFVEQRFARPPPDPTNGRACCDHLRGLSCRWHHLSRDIYHRPNALFMFSQSLPPSFRGARVNSLAKASDFSPNFYIGITGGVIEANLGAINSQEFDPHLGFPDYTTAVPRSASWSTSPPSTYASTPVPAMMMELGDGLRSVSNTETIRMPMVHSRVGDTDRRERRLLDSIDPVLRKKHRLDERWQKIEDFSQDLEDVERVMVPPPPPRRRRLDWR